MGQLHRVTGNGRKSPLAVQGVSPATYKTVTLIVDGEHEEQHREDDIQRDSRWSNFTTLFSTSISRQHGAPSLCSSLAWTSVVAGSGARNELNRTRSAAPAAFATYNTGKLASRLSAGPLGTLDPVAPHRCSFYPIKQPCPTEHCCATCQTTEVT